MRFLVFQHLAVEHPGVFRDFFVEAGIEWDVVELDEGQPIPDLNDYDALWAMGGPMDVWEVDDHPWLVAEKAAIREAVNDRGMPFLGCCLGHQLLADALGGVCAKLSVPEIGVFNVELTAAGLSDPFFTGLAPVCEVLQWHGVEVIKIPPGGTVLAQSPACAVQALRVGKHAYGIQFHIEVTDTTVQEWRAVPGYRNALESALGAGAIDKIDADCAARRAGFQDAARRLFDNFIELVRNYRV
jgi:GMP synthase-like glutamine amidotransferase